MLAFIIQKKFQKIKILNYNNKDYFYYLYLKN